jgi:hypothetical protein
MNATLSFRGRRLLPLLVMSCGFACYPASAQADLLTSRLTDKSNPSQTEALAGSASAQVVYRSRREDGTTEEDSERGESRRVSTLPALAVIMVFPPFQPPPPPPPPPPPVIQPPPVVVPPPPSDGGTGHVSGGPTPPSGTPEPASLILALTGSGTAAFLTLVRRRRRRSALASAR